MNKIAFQRPSLTEIAYEEIKNRICLGTFSPGDKLVVEDMVKSFAISNTPIKEALNRLAAEGLVETLPRKGMQVKKIGPKEVSEINDMRLMFEKYCARKAVDVINDRPDIKAELLNLLKAFEKLSENCSSHDYKRHTEVDEKFHMIIISLSENETMIKEYRKLKSIHMAINNYSYRELPLKRCKEAVKEHKAIYEALINKNVDQLMSNIERHILNVNKDILDFLKQ